MEKINYKYYNRHYKVYVPIVNNSAVVKAVKSNRIWEQKIQDIIVEYTDNDKTSVCVDIGAYIGVHTILMASRSQKVFSFEPQKLVGECLFKTILENNLDNVIFNNCGLWNKKGLMPFVTNNDGDASIAQYRKRKFKENYLVQVHKLDDFNLDRCDLIKLDAEGSEFEVLAGAMKTIEKFHPIIIIEVWKTISRIHLLEEFACECGYDVRSINAENFLLTPIGYDC